MGAMDEAATEENVARAWRWIRSNPEAAYKSHFRELYAAYAIADESLLADLRNRLRREIYEPNHSTKLYLPKASGILRPVSLLTIEDQIAYQSAVNVVAERLFPRVRARYLKEVFGHLYAGRSSIWFYRKWSTGYTAFNAAARKAFKDGYRFAASFDLTACYDSLDHRVLCHFMQRLGLRPDFCKTLTDWLCRWTATDHRIYHNHGIPQGPLSSGLLSEVVLQHFDANRGRESKVKYFRYVDDIRLFGKSELELRKMLVTLDYLSKDIGLFPQASKISIHEVTDIEAELKSVSSPVESVLRSKVVDQAKLRKRLVRLSPRFDVANPTRFKYLLSHAAPHHSVTSRLWRIYEKSPEFYANLCRYLSKYETLPTSTAKRVFKEIRQQRLYFAVAAAFINAACTRVPKSLTGVGDRMIVEMWKPNVMQPVLVVAAGRWAVENKLLTDKKLEYACTRLRSWWARSRLVLFLNADSASETLLNRIVNNMLRNQIPDCSIAAASQVDQLGTTLVRPIRGINDAGGHVLKELGHVRRVGRRPCGIDLSLSRMLGTVDVVNWRAFFRHDYRKAERQIVNCRARWDTDMTAWVNAMDVFNDWLLGTLYRRDTRLGTYGGLGSVLAPSGRLASHYPATFAMVDSVHQKRYGSLLSHATERRTGRATGVVRYSYARTVAPLIRRAVTELSLTY